MGIDVIYHNFYNTSTIFFREVRPETILTRSWLTPKYTASFFNSSLVSPAALSLRFDRYGYLVSNDFQLPVGAEPHWNWVLHMF